MKDVLNKVLLTSFVQFTRHEKGSSIGTKTGVIAVKGLTILLLVLSLTQCVIRYALHWFKNIIILRILYQFLTYYLGIAIYIILTEYTIALTIVVKLEYTTYIYMGLDTMQLDTFQVIILHLVKKFYLCIKTN